MTKHKAHTRTCLQSIGGCLVTSTALIIIAALLPVIGPVICAAAVIAMTALTIIVTLTNRG